MYEGNQFYNIKSLYAFVGFATISKQVKAWSWIILKKKSYPVFLKQGLSQYTVCCDDTTGMMTTKSWFHSQQEQEIFLLFKTCSLVMVPT
jgi:hypothetical protein